MPSIIVKMLIQKGCYWAPGSPDRNGKPTYPIAPVGINVWWDDNSEEMMGPGGRTFVSKAKVFVEFDVEPGGVLWLSPLPASADNADAIALLTDATKPFANDGAFEIKRYDKQPTLTFGLFLRTAYL